MVIITILSTLFLLQCRNMYCDWLTNHEAINGLIKYLHWLPALFSIQDILGNKINALFMWLYLYYSRSGQNSLFIRTSMFQVFECKIAAQIGRHRRTKYLSLRLNFGIHFQHQSQRSCIYPFAKTSIWTSSIFFFLQQLIRKRKRYVLLSLSFSYYYSEPFTDLS